MIVLLFLSLFSQGIKVDTLENHFVKRFGEEPSEEYIISYVTDVEYYKGLLYLVDWKENRIMVYDTLGNFIRQIGRPGQAPGEFYAPSEMRIISDRIYVMDSGNKRIEIFSLDGEFIHSISLKFSFSSRSLEVDKSGNIYLSCPDKDGLITVIDQKGAIIRRFGKPITPPRNKPISIWDNGYILMSEKGDSIFYLFEAEPVLHTYNTEGDLLFEGKIPTGIFPINVRIKQQKEMLEQQINHPSYAYAVYPMFGVSKLHNNRLIVKDSGGGFIYVLNRKGDVERIFYQKKFSEEEYWGNFPFPFAVGPSGRIWRVYSGGIFYLTLNL